MTWVPRDKNTVADRISKWVERDDWQVQGWFFTMLDSFWGPHTINVFANNLNAKLPRFYSRFWTEGTSGVDGFAYSWEGENCWLTPISLIPKTIRYLQTVRTCATLIVPYWVSATFWPLLIDGQGHFLQFVVDVKLFSDARGIFKEGSVPSVFNSNFQGSVLALKVDTR